MRVRRLCGARFRESNDHVPHPRSQRLVALYRVTIDLVYFYNDDRPGDMDRKSFHSLPRLLGKDNAGHWKGRCFCVPQDSFSINDVLPPDPEELTSTFRV